MSLPSFWWPQVFFGLWQHNSSPCLHLHTGFFSLHICFYIIFPLFIRILLILGLRAHPAAVGFHFDLLNYIYNDPTSKQSHILTYRGLGVQHLWGEAQFNPELYFSVSTQNLFTPPGLALFALSCACHGPLLLLVYA